MTESSGARARAALESAHERETVEGAISKERVGVTTADNSMDDEAISSAVFAAEMGLATEFDAQLVTLTALRIAKLQPEMTIDHLRKTIHGDISLASGLLKMPDTPIDEILSLEDRAKYGIKTHDLDAPDTYHLGELEHSLKIDKALEHAHSISDDAKVLQTPIKYILNHPESEAGCENAKQEILEILSVLGNRLHQNGADNAMTATIVGTTLNMQVEQAVAPLEQQAKGTFLDILDSRRQDFFRHFERPLSLQVEGGGNAHVKGDGRDRGSINKD